MSEQIPFSYFSPVAFTILVAILLFIVFWRRYQIPNSLMRWFFWAGLPSFALAFFIWTYWRGMPYGGLIIGIGLNIFLIYTTVSRNKYIQWTDWEFINAAIIITLLISGFHSVHHLVMQHPTVCMQQAFDLIEWGQLAPGFIIGISINGWLWTIFGVWQAIYATRLKQSRAANYDEILLYIADLLDRIMYEAHSNVHRANHLHPVEYMKKNFTVKMVLYTPSNGNVSAKYLSVYKKYRERLLQAANNPNVYLEITCLSERGLTRYYRSYINEWIVNTDSRDKAKTFINYGKLACTEALALYKELEEAEEKHRDSFKFIDEAYDIHDLMPEHLVLAPHEAWIWIPHRLPQPRQAKRKLKLEQEYQQLLPREELKSEDEYQQSLQNAKKNIFEKLKSATSTP